MDDRDAAAARHLRAELAHWRAAAESLSDLDTVAAPAAWASLEHYLRRGVRDRLTTMGQTLVAEAMALERAAASGADEVRVRTGLLRLRSRYVQVEAVLDFYGDAVNTRTNATMRSLLGGFDVLAADSMAASLGPLGIAVPPALVYVDKGLGAAILRAGVRLWDGGNPSPVAAIKLTRHNLTTPTALLHETGHQFGHLTGWNTELGDELHRTLAHRSREVAELWRSWASELAADVHAFAQAGGAPVVALANVVDGPAGSAHRIRVGDPHPYPLIRVAFNVACCRSWYGPGPWDDVATAWARRHPPTDAGAEVAAITRISLEAMGELVDVCTRTPMTSFGGRPLAALMDPHRVSPRALGALERQAGATLLTSEFLRRREPLRILALLVSRVLSGSRAAAADELLRWIGGLAGGSAAEGAA